GRETHRSRFRRAGNDYVASIVEYDCSQMIFEVRGAVERPRSAPCSAARDGIVFLNPEVALLGGRTRRGSHDEVTERIDRDDFRPAGGVDRRRREKSSGHVVAKSRQAREIASDDHDRAVYENSHCEGGLLPHTKRRVVSLDPDRYQRL